MEIFFDRTAQAPRQAWRSKPRGLVSPAKALECDFFYDQICRYPKDPAKIDWIFWRTFSRHDPAVLSEVLRTLARRRETQLECVTDCHVTSLLALRHTRSTVRDPRATRSRARPALRQHAYVPMGSHPHSSMGST